MDASCASGLVLQEGRYMFLCFCFRLSSSVNVNFRFLGEVQILC